MADKKWVEKTFDSREERERLGRQINKRFAETERAEVEAGSENIPTGPIDLDLSEEEIRRRVGSGNFESAKDDRQTNSINS
ncbi:hypothetical protein [Indiicoccus explosivorum]|uniref:hypothetical protein n=1 Tax=Indiicoccus explosivorum TaxID=1917864 RepID=UPI000B439F62|nr:hypothetical protein [Indiicoccus explosivorum]